MIRIILTSTAATMLLAGCMGQSQIGANATAMNSIATLQRSAQTQPSEADLSLSCAQINSELNRLYQRSAQLEQAARAEERKGALARGAVNAGIAAITLGGITGAGSVEIGRAHV